MNEQQKKVKDMASKAENYGKYVKEMYWPKVSESKKNELDKFIKNIHHQSPAMLTKILNTAKSPNGVEQRAREVLNKDGSISNLGPNWKETFKDVSQRNKSPSKSTANLKKPDYLSEARNHRESIEMKLDPSSRN